MGLVDPAVCASHPRDACICNNGAVVEEDQRMQLDRSPSRHLSVAMPSVEVVCECVHACPVPGRFWEGG